MTGDKKRFVIAFDSGDDDQLSQSTQNHQIYHSSQFKEKYQTNAMVDTLEFLSPHQEANVQQL